VAEQDFEKAELLIAEVQRARPALDADVAAGGVEVEAAEAEVNALKVRNRLGRRVCPAQERAEAGEEFLERERLREVVVGPGVETGHTVLHVAEGGQHEDGHGEAARTETLDEGAPIKARKPPVYDEGIVPARERFEKAPLPVGLDRDDVALLFQPTPDGLGDGRLVLDEQEAVGRGRGSAHEGGTCAI
jgi:hypothetical protein